MSADRIVLAGGSGFIGQALARFFRERGWEVVVLTRSPARAERAMQSDAKEGGVGSIRFVEWYGKSPGAWTGELDGARAVVNLAGKNVNCRYTPQNLREIEQSRTESVRAVGSAIARCASPPAVLVQSGTLAIYGDAGERVCDESCPPGEGIPPATAVAWERAFEQTPTPGTRRALLRISFALGGDGGALTVLVRLTRWFLGGRVGSGKQYISWIHIEDLCRVVLWIIERDDARGVYNVTSPRPVPNAQFMRELRRVLGRPWSPPAPAPLVHAGAWLMRTEPVLALTGRRGTPARLVEQGFEFRHPDLAETLRDLLRSPRSAKLGGSQARL